MLDRGITSLNLDSNNIDDAGAKDLADALPETQIISLNLRRNVISDEGVKALANTLPRTLITSLNLIGNKICDEGAKALAGVLLDTQITTLNLARNDIGKPGVAVLAKALSQSNLILDVRGLFEKYLIPRIDPNREALKAKFPSYSDEHTTYSIEDLYYLSRITLPTIDQVFGRHADIKAKYLDHPNSCKIHAIIMLDSLNKHVEKTYINEDECPPVLPSELLWEIVNLMFEYIKHHGYKSDQKFLTIEDLPSEEAYRQSQDLSRIEELPEEYGYGDPVCEVKTLGEPLLVMGCTSPEATLTLE